MNKMYKQPNLNIGIRVSGYNDYVAIEGCDREGNIVDGVYFAKGRTILGYSRDEQDRTMYRTKYVFDGQKIMALVIDEKSPHVESPWEAWPSLPGLEGEILRPFYHVFD